MLQLFQLEFKIDATTTPPRARWLGPALAGNKAELEVHAALLKLQR